MAWLVLVASGLLEAVWAVALGASNGFRRLVPVIVFAVAAVASLAGLAYAMKHLPPATAYAVWVGIGAALPVAYAMITGDEPASWLKVLFILGIVGCVIGLKLVGDHETPVA